MRRATRITAIVMVLGTLLLTAVTTYGHDLHSAAQQPHSERRGVQ